MTALPLLVSVTPRARRRTIIESSRLTEGLPLPPEGSTPREAFEWAFRAIRFTRREADECWTFGDKMAHHHYRTVHAHLRAMYPHAAAATEFVIDALEDLPSRHYRDRLVREADFDDVPF